MKEIGNKLIAGGEALNLKPAAVAAIFAALTLLKLLCDADGVCRTNPAGGSTAADYVAALGRSLTSDDSDGELQEAFSQLIIGERTDIRQTFRGDS